MKIYTKKGDKGTTGLFGGKRVPKDDIRVHCIGTLDEANSTIGLLRTKLGNEHEW
jgi:cob(I)alamin adenosyltransferase